jgi:hypothetical protein
MDGWMDGKLWDARKWMMGSIGRSELWSGLLELGCARRATKGWLKPKGGGYGEFLFCLIRLAGLDAGELKYFIGLGGKKTLSAEGEGENRIQTTSVARDVSALKKSILVFLSTQTWKRA